MNDMARTNDYSLALQTGKMAWVTDPELRDQQFPDPEYLIEPELPAKSFVLSIGAPKTGKTALSLPICLKLAREGKHVLYLVLDDSARRMRSRSIMAEPQRDPGHQNLEYIFNWNPKDKLEAFGQLQGWLELARTHNRAYDMVVVDTYGRFVGRKPSGDVFGYDYETGQAFKRLATDFSSTILVNHHARKSRGDKEESDWLEMVSGTQGIAAAADAIWYITRTRGSREGMWRITGNDMEDIERPMILGPDMVWRQNFSVTPAQAARTGTPRLILDFLMVQPVASIQEIRDTVGSEPNTVHSAVARLREDGLIEFLDGAWTLTPHPDNQLPQQPEESETVRTPEPAAQNTYPRQETLSTPTQTPANSQVAQLTGADKLTLDLSKMVPQEEIDAAPEKERGGMERRGAIDAAVKLLEATVNNEERVKYGLSERRLHPALRVTEYPEAVKEVWTGKNKFKADVDPQTPVTKLDKSATYLGSVNTQLPLSRLSHDDDPEAAFNGTTTDGRKQNRAGLHLTDVDRSLPLGGPFAGRTEDGRVWVPTPIMKAIRRVEPDAPIYDSYTGPSTEGIMRDWQEILRDLRTQAIDTGNNRLKSFVKHSYSMFVSTCGESPQSGIRRLDWKPIFESQAAAILWMQALQMQTGGLTVVRVAQTDEIWVANTMDEVRQAAARGVLKLDETGRQIGSYKVKGSGFAGDPR